MKRQSIDLDGNRWQIVWGVTDPIKALSQHFDFAMPLKNASGNATFVDPLYPNETKTLIVFNPSEENSDLKVVMAEISAGIFAVGVSE